jgi:hypothetical protein
MPALRALKLAHGALLGVPELTVDQIRERVGSRYPEATPIPGRPELDGLLREAGWDFEWIHQEGTGAGVYRTRQRPGVLLTSGSSSSLGRLTGGEVPPVEVTPEIAEARRLEERLEHAVRQGDYLALMVEPRFLPHAERELIRRFPVEARSIEEVMIRRMREAAGRAGADWSTVLAADSAPVHSRDWQNLLVLVGRAIVAVEEELYATGQAKGRPLLLTYPGLLARYGQLDLLQRLRDAAGRRDGMPAIWVLVGADGQHEAPVIDGKPVPVVTRSEWARVPDAWIRGLHRGPDPAPSTGDGQRLARVSEEG